MTEPVDTQDYVGLSCEMENDAYVEMDVKTVGVVAWADGDRQWVALRLGDVERYVIIEGSPGDVLAVISQAERSLIHEIASRLDKVK